MSFAKEALLAVVGAAWIVGLVHQFGSWSLTAFYVGISLPNGGRAILRRSWT